MGPSVCRTIAALVAPIPVEARAARRGRSGSVENGQGLRRRRVPARGARSSPPPRRPPGISESPEDARRGTIAYGILQAHNASGDPSALKIRFDAMASHDITYVGVVQTARASGMTELPLPYVLTNCHNSLCAVGGTINEDDHVFGLSAAKKYGGIYVPAHQAVIHSFMRKNFAGCGKIILGSDCPYALWRPGRHGGGRGRRRARQAAPARYLRHPLSRCRRGLPGRTPRPGVARDTSRSRSSGPSSRAAT